MLFFFSFLLHFFLSSGLSCLCIYYLRPSYIVHSFSYSFPPGHKKEQCSAKPLGPMLCLPRPLSPPHFPPFSFPLSSFSSLLFLIHHHHYFPPHIFPVSLSLLPSFTSSPSPRPSSPTCPTSRARHSRQPSHSPISNTRTWWLRAAPPPCSTAQPQATRKSSSLAPHPTASLPGEIDPDQGDHRRPPTGRRFAQRPW